MLVALAIRDIVLIDRLNVDFSRGMTVLTGETGAGKSILLDALSLALGGRGDSALVRAGASQGDVTALGAGGRREAEVAGVAAAERDWRAARGAVSGLEKRTASARAEADYLRAAV